MKIIDLLISVGIFVSFIYIIASRFYAHEKSRVDPLMDKIKGLFSPKEQEDDNGDTGNDFELEFKGQMQ